MQDQTEQKTLSTQIHKVVWVIFLFLNFLKWKSGDLTGLCSLCKTTDLD